MSKPVPRSRLNISYRTEIDGKQAKVKLPMRFLVLGDFTGKAPGLLGDRKVHSIMSGMKLNTFMQELKLTVPIEVDGLKPASLPGKLVGDVTGKLEKRAETSAPTGTVKFTGTGIVTGDKSNGLGSFTGKVLISGEAEVPLVGGEPKFPKYYEVELTVRGKVEPPESGDAKVGAPPEAGITGSIDQKFKIKLIENALLHNDISIDIRSAVTSEEVKVQLTIPIRSLNDFKPLHLAASVPEIRRLVLLHRLVLEARNYISSFPELRDLVKAELAETWKQIRPPKDIEPKAVRDTKLGQLQSTLRTNYPQLMVDAKSARPSARVAKAVTEAIKADGAVKAAADAATEAATAPPDTAKKAAAMNAAKAAADAVKAAADAVKAAADAVKAAADGAVADAAKAVDAAIAEVAKATPETKSAAEAAKGTADTAKTAADTVATEAETAAKAAADAVTKAVVAIEAAAEAVKAPTEEAKKTRADTAKTDALNALKSATDAVKAAATKISAAKETAQKVVAEAAKAAAEAAKAAAVAAKAAVVAAKAAAEAAKQAQSEANKAAAAAPSDETAKNAAETARAAEATAAAAAAALAADEAEKTAALVKAEAFAVEAATAAADAAAEAKMTPDEAAKKQAEARALIGKLLTSASMEPSLTAVALVERSGDETTSLMFKDREGDFPPPDRFANALAALFANIDLFPVAKVGEKNQDIFPVDSIRNLMRAVDKLAVDIDKRVQENLHRVVHSEPLRKLEETWRSLDYLCGEVTSDQVIIDFIDADKGLLGRDFEDHSSYILNSALFRKVYIDEYDRYGGRPIGTMIGLYEFDSSDEDIDWLQTMSKISAAAHCPFISAVSPKFFQVKTWEELERKTDLEELLALPQFGKWDAFRESHNAAYIGLVLPRYLLRKPYDQKAGKNQIVSFEEKIAGPESYLWGNAAVLFARNMVRSFQHSGWCQHITGPVGGGRVKGLPVHMKDHHGQAELQPPVELAIPDYRELQFANAGFIPLIHCKGTADATFFSARSVKKAIEFEADLDTKNADLVCNLSYTLSITRIAHYVKRMVRDYIGSTADAPYIQATLEAWLVDYVTTAVNPDDLTLLYYPFKAMSVTVAPKPGPFGWYNCIVSVLPHVQFQGMDVELRLEASLGGK